MNNNIDWKIPVLNSDTNTTNTTKTIPSYKVKSILFKVLFKILFKKLKNQKKKNSIPTTEKKNFQVQDRRKSLPLKSKNLLTVSLSRNVISRRNNFHHSFPLTNFDPTIPKRHHEKILITSLVGALGRG